MKSDIAYYLLILYVLAICKPLMPLVHDVLAHNFWKAQHIATVHNHNGEHHAEEEIAKEMEDEHNNAVPSTSKTSDTVSIHLISESSHIIPQLFVAKNIFETRMDKVYSLILDQPYPPPRFC